MQDVFKPQSLSIKELFGNTDALYQIPIYQRPYKWGSEEVDKLCQDLWDAFESNEPNYFLGSVITAKPQELSNYLDVVDGQQRLTTLLILFCCYRDKFPNVNVTKIDTDPHTINLDILHNSIIYNGRFSRLRLVTHASHQSDFDAIVLKGNTTKCKRPSKTNLAKDEEPKYKFSNTSSIFIEWLNSVNLEQAGKFLDYVFNNVMIIRIDCSSVNFAIKLFQVLNDRGLDLTNSDLIKSYLLEKIYKQYVKEESLQKLKADQFMADWREIENIVKDSFISMNELLVVYEYYLLAGNPRRSIYEELQGYFRNLDSNEVIADFKKFAWHHKTDLVDKEDKIIYSFWYLRWTVYWKSILLTALHTSYPDYDGLVRCLQRYYYLNWIAGFTMTRIKQISFNLIKWVKEMKPLSFIEKEIKEKLSSDSVVNRAIEQLNLDMFFAGWCKPLLCLIEYNQTDNSLNSWIDIWDRDLHVEHILPRKFQAISGWELFVGDENVEQWINSAANLTLLSGKKNIEASNNSFKTKINVYRGKGKYNANDTKITAFRITQKIVDDFSSNKYDQEWNWVSLNDRWEWFCDEIEQILEIDMSSLRNQAPSIETKTIN